MLRFEGKAFVEAINGLSTMMDIGAQDPAWVLVPERLVHMERLLKDLDTELSNLDLPLSRKVCGRMLLQIKSDNSEYAQTTVTGRLRELLKDLKNRIEDELEGRVIYCLSPEEGAFAKTEPEPFGSDAARAFPSAEPELEEARKCIAFSRYTASVFHLMRAMEVAVIAAGGKLSATVQDSNGNFLQWGPILSNIGAKIDTMQKGEIANKWKSAHAMLHHVKDAWRNQTMHPRDTYTEEQAIEVYAAVKGFMRQLAPLL